MELTTHVTSEPAATRDEDEAAETAAWSESAFEGFYADTRDGLWRYLRRVSGDPALADDVLQDAYLRVLRKPGREATPKERRSYLYRVATNLLKDRWRRRGRERSLLDRLVGRDPAWTVPSPAGPVGDRLDLASALDGLAPRERSLLWLAYAEGLSHREIARVMDVKPDSVKVMLFRAKKKLLDRIEP